MVMRLLAFFLFLSGRKDSPMCVAAQLRDHSFRWGHVGVRRGHLPRERTQAHSRPGHERNEFNTVVGQGAAAGESASK